MQNNGFKDDYLTLTEAANLTPGRPSANCLWRWCRRGVISRSGERVRLQHARMGGKIFTTTAWLEEFGRRLADADRRYFELAETAAAAQVNYPRSRRQASTSQFEAQRRREIEQADRELEEAGL
jgi:hypothetical protein